ncbi:MAG: GntR family transcriptional regulator [Solirubrobacteraceae bacterium]|nr:GntR family transcriptional regulator [Solirubrobacteraceae bacterium]
MARTGAKKSQSKQEQVYEVLRRRILDGTYPPGYRLVIDTIGRELGVSPMPVREAIRRLEAEHWVIYQRHAGAQVAPRDQESWAEAIESLALLEGFVTARAAPHMTADDFARMREIDREMYADVEELDILGLTEHNEAFHRIIWERCPNRLLRRQVEEAQQRLNAMRSTIYFPMTRGRPSIDEHEELIVMLEEGRDPDEIERFAREHKLRTIEARNRRQRAAEDAAGAPAS